MINPGYSHSHSHGHSHGKNENMYGIYLHILADVLGSVGVIISSLMIEHWNWYRSDPVCTLLIGSVKY